MESNVDKIPAADLHGKVTKNSVSSLLGEAVTSSTNLDSDVPDNGAAIGLSLSGQEQLTPFCLGYFSNFTVRSDVDLASFGNDSVVEPSTVPPASYDLSVPPDDLCDFMLFIINNLSSSSLPTITDQFWESFSQEYLPWVD